jgi:pimeloyl-ACP methyl ester carboxylesterase
VAVIATTQWLTASGATFRANDGHPGVADLRHYNASFCEWGEGQPIILVPGLAGSFELLGPLARELARHYRVISYRLRGEDDCFALRRRFGLRDLVADLREFIAWHGLERPVVVGVSFGGVLALELAASHPHCIQAVGVQGVGIRFERGLVQRIASLVLSGYPLPPDSPFVNQFFNLLFGSRQSRPLFEFVTRQCWQTDQSVMAHRLHLVERLDLAARLAKVTIPAYVLAGERDLLVSPQSLQELSAGLPHSRGEMLEGCGHLAFVTHPQLVAAKLHAFIGGLQ